MPILCSRRLRLVPADAALIRLESGNHAALGSALNAEIPLEWPPEEARGALEFFAVQAEHSPDGSPWRIYYWISNAGPESRGVLVGSGGFVGMPNTDGSVEIGYGTLAKFRGQGYAAEACGALVQWALSQPGITHVIADAQPSNIPSHRVLLRIGFTATGQPGAEKGSARYHCSR